MRHRRAGLLAPPTDAELIERARGGDAPSFALLHDRYAPAAHAAARALCRNRTDADDVVAEAFTRVLNALRNGNGPTEAFKPYLLQCVRNAVIDRSRRDGRIDLTEDPPEAVNDGDAFGDSVERAIVAEAFTRIPERWQAVLWHTEVEGRPAAELAPVLGLSPNAVAALAYRAREGLRQAYLQAHVQQTPNGACQPVVMQLGAYVRGSVSPRERVRIAAHLEACTSCQAVHDEVAELSVSLRRVLVPAVLGAGVAYESLLPHLPHVSGLVAQVGTSVARVAAGWSARLGGRGDDAVRWLQSNPTNGAGVGAAAAAAVAIAASVGAVAVVTPPSAGVHQAAVAMAAPSTTTRSTQVAGAYEERADLTPAEWASLGVVPSEAGQPLAAAAAGVEDTSTSVPAVDGVLSGGTVPDHGTAALPTAPTAAPTPVPTGGPSTSVNVGGIVVERPVTLIAPPVRDDSTTTPPVPTSAAGAPSTSGTSTLPTPPTSGAIQGAAPGDGVTQPLPTTAAPTTAPAPPAGPRSLRPYARVVTPPANGRAKVAVDLLAEGVPRGEPSASVLITVGGGEISAWGGSWDCVVVNPAQARCTPDGDANGTVWFRMTVPGNGPVTVQATTAVAGDTNPDDDSWEAGS